jgi:hypothetical protein
MDPAIWQPWTLSASDLLHPLASVVMVMVGGGVGGRGGGVATRGVGLRARARRVTPLNLHPLHPPPSSLAYSQYLCAQYSPLFFFQRKLPVVFAGQTQ